MVHKKIYRQCFGRRSAPDGNPDEQYFFIVGPTLNSFLALVTPHNQLLIFYQEYKRKLYLKIYLWLHHPRQCGETMATFKLPCRIPSR